METGNNEGGNEGNGNQGADFASNVASGESFLSSVPEEFRSEPSLQSIKDMPGLVKSYVNAQKMIGKNIHVPTGDDQAEWDSFHDKAGRPESADKYDLKLGDNVNKDAESIKALKESLYKSGLSNRQAQVFSEQMSGVVDKIVAEKQAAAEAEDLDFSQKAQEVYGGEEGWAKVMAQTENYLIANVPAEIRSEFSNLGSKELLTVVGAVQAIINSSKAEGQPVSSGEPVSESLKSPQEYNEDLYKLYADEEFGQPTARGKELKAEEDKILALLIKSENLAGKGL